MLPCRNTAAYFLTLHSKLGRDSSFCLRMKVISFEWFRCALFMIEEISTDICKENILCELKTVSVAPELF